ncbi:MAG: glucuronate isomerase, partial [Sphingomonas sp.]
MPRPLTLDPDRLFSADATQRGLARALYQGVADLPIVSPHGHTDARWFADDQPWSNATALLLAPDHYLYRMLYSQGVDLDALAIPRRDG